MSELKDFFNWERKRVFTPGLYFTQKVMARLNERQEYGIWESVPTSARPVFAVALLLILCVVGVHMFFPQAPQRGMIEAFLEIEQNPAESVLFSETEVPQEFLEQLIGLEDQQ